MGSVPPVALVARLAQRILVIGLNHLLEHCVGDVAQLECGCLGRDRLTVEDVRTPLVHAGEAGLRGLVALLLPPGDDRRAHDGVVDVAEVQALVTARQVSFGLVARRRMAHTSAHRGPHEDRTPGERMYLAMARPRTRTKPEAVDIWSYMHEHEHEHINSTEGRLWPT